MIHTFCKELNYELKEELITIDKKTFLINKKIKKILTNIKEKPKNAGLLLGYEKNKLFHPSINLLKLISEKTNKKIQLNKKGAWLFICGRDIMKESIMKLPTNKGKIIVCDEKENVLGIAQLKKHTDSNNIIAKNIFDIGDFLRREKR